jgi:general secretion pathway protein L
MLSEFFSWWVRRLAGFLPARLRRTHDGGPATIIFLHAGEAPGITISLIGRRRTQTLCHVGLDKAGLAQARAALGRARRPARVVLRLPETALLEREVALPLAAERDPDAVLGYEMDRLTPFRAADVVWRASGLKRDRARNRLSLRLSLMPRSLFAAALPTLARIGLKLDSVEAPAPGGGWRRIPLATSGTGHAEERRLRLAAGLVAGLAVIAVALPFVRQSLAGRALAARIAVLQPRVAEAEALRARAGGATSGADAIAALAARVGNPLAVLAALTDSLPDDTYLESLALSKRHLAITGRSAAAARLIGLLAADSLVRNPVFTAPVTRAPSGGDEFAIRAEVGP